MYTETQRESNPTSSHSAIVSGKNDPPIATNQMKKPLHHLELDSGLPGDDPGTPDTEGQIVVSPPILSSEVSTTCTHVPVNKKMRLREQHNNSDAMGRLDDPEDTDTPVPTSGGSVNIEAQQPRLDVAPYPQNTHFTIGPPEDVGASIEEDAQSEQVSSSSLSNVAKESVPAQIDEAKKYLSSSVINEIETLRKDNEKLKRQLSELSQEKEILNDRYKQLQKSAKEKEEASKKELKEKEKELEKCKQKLAKAELEHEEKCTQLEEELKQLKQKINDEKESNEKEILELKLQLSQKENIICVKEKEIAELEKKILEKEKEEIKDKLLQEKEKSTEHIRKLTKENEEMRERERELLKNKEQGNKEQEKENESIAQALLQFGKETLQQFWEQLDLGEVLFFLLYFSLCFICIWYYFVFYY